MFPFTLNFKVNFIVQCWLDKEPGTRLEWPFHYTVKSAKHYGLLVLGSARTRNGYNPTPVRKHFRKYASAIANQVLAYKKPVHKILVLVRPENEDWAASGRHYYGYQIDQMGPKAYFILRNEYTNMLYNAVALTASLHLEKIGYKPIRKPRKCITKNLCRWRNYKGLWFAEIRGNSADIRLDEQYEGSLLDIGILPEVIKHVNKRNCTDLLWEVNTPAQAVEAKLLVPDSEVRIKEVKEVEVLPF